MAQPTGHQNVLLPAAQGMPSSEAPTLIPNGQPHQWGRPPPMPHSIKSRPSPTGSNVTPSVSNGTPTPPSYHPGSLSSNSSRDPSPIPPNRHGDNFSSSSPNIMLNSQHPQSQTPPGLQRVSPGMSSGSTQPRIPPYSAPGMPPSLVNQNIGQSKSASVLSGTPSPQIGSPLPPSHRSTSNLPPDSPSPQNIPSPYVNQTTQQKLGSSQMPPQSLGQNSKNQQNIDGRPDVPSPNSVVNGPPLSSGGTVHQVQGTTVPRTSAQGFMPHQQPMRPQGMSPMQRPQPYQLGMPMQRPPSSHQMPPSGMPPMLSGDPHKPPTSMGGYSQPGIPPRVSPSQPGMPSPNTGYPQSSLPPSSTGFSQSPLPPTSASLGPSGLPPTSTGSVQSSTSQTGMPPTSAAYSHSGHPTSKGYPQPGIPPTSQPGMPPPSRGLSQPGMPPTISGYTQPGMSPSSSGHSQSGMPPTSGGLSQPGIPPTSSSYSHMGMPPTSTAHSQAGMLPTSSGYSHPGMPPTSVGLSQPGMPPTSLGHQHSGQTRPGMPPASSGYSQPGMPPTSLGHSQPGMPPTSSGYSQPGMPPTSLRHPQPGMPPQSSGMPPTSSGYSQPGMPPTSSTHPQAGMPPTSPAHPQPGMPPTSPGYSQPGMPPTSSGYSHPGAPPSSGGYSQPGFSQPPVSNQFQPTQQDSSHLGKRYPQQPYQPQRGQASGDAIAPYMSGLSVTQMGFNKLWGMESIDLLQNRNVLPAQKVEPPDVRLHQEFLDSVNCSPEIFRCTLTKIPETNSLLQKSRLPLGILIHPFKDLNHLPVIQCSTIVRCRSCRTYINPFVYFVDHKRWKCNLCFRVNELPEEFQYDPVSKTYGDPTRRPEVKSATIEFIAPSEYMLRPPQPAVYLFLLDVSRLGVDCGYLRLFCDILLEELDKLPGDGRTQIGFITYDSCVHFYNLAEGLNQPQQMIVVDTDDVFLPCPDNLLVNLSESRELVKDLLNQIPTKFLNSHDTNSSLGAALQAAYKLMAPTGGRVTVFQTCLPNHGPGMLTVREDPSQRAGKEAPHLNPATDFYKRLALDCSGQQIAVDLFLINSQYSDLATISGISRFSGGCIYHFPLFKASNTIMADSLERTFRRYLTRKIGFEAVMRIRCSRGLAIHTFHGNFFVRSTDLLSLPNVNPDAGFGMQVSIEESLSDLQNICFQAALLYTSSKGERRIRVHTLCLPVAANLSDILYSADQQCIVGLLAKMAVDRSHQSSLSDARDAFINVAIDVLAAYKLVQSNPSSTSLLAPVNLRLLPLYILALLKYIAFRTGQSTRLDDRLFAMCQMKTLPVTNLIQAIYPDMYPVHYLDDKSIEEVEVDGVLIPQPPRLHLSAEKLDSHGAFLMDAGDYMMMYVGHNISSEFCSAVLGVPAFSHIPEEMFELPENESPESGRLRSFVNHLQSEKPYQVMFQVIRDDSHYRAKFIERLIEDRSESALSYYEFLQHLKSNIK